MDGVSSKIKLDFVVDNKPSPPFEDIVKSQIDGRLVMIVDGIVVFDEDYILILEFSSLLFRWLNRKNINETFLYESMDYEDSPILKVDIHGEIAHIYSVWFISGIKQPITVPLSCFVHAANVFLDKVENEIPNISSVY